MVQRLPYKLVYVSCNASTAWMLDSRCIQNTTSDHRLDYFLKKCVGVPPAISHQFSLGNS